MDPTDSLPQRLSSLALDRDDPNPPPQTGPPATSLSSVSATRDPLTDEEHRNLDAEIDARFPLNRQYGEPPDLETLLVALTAGYSGAVAALTLGGARALLANAPPLETLLVRAWMDGSFKQIRRLEILWPAVEIPDQRPSTRRELESVTVEESETATLRSWNIQYVGDASQLLYEHMQRHARDEDAYARCISMVQSSGMGKSRAVDELSKTRLVVPLVLRKGSTGFPPPDGGIRDWLLRSRSQRDAFARSSTFLAAVFRVLYECLSTLDARLDDIEPPIDGALRASTPARFRHLMVSGQTFAQQGRPRGEFYTKVLGLANELLLSKDQVQRSPTDLRKVDHSFPVVGALGDLIGLLDKDSSSPAKRSSPALILSFDEAHTLTDIEVGKDGKQWSRFGELRRALRVIEAFPCFSVFLSTTGKVNQFTPRKQDDSSGRLQSGDFTLLPPFCELGFDQLAEKAVEGEATLEHVASTEYMAKLGRPLFGSRYMAGNSNTRSAIVQFAGQKLLCKPFETKELFIKGLSDEEKLACMAVRLPLEFNTTTLQGQRMQSELVEKHMRVCIRVDPEYGATVTVAPSEPLLAEAAYCLTRDPAFNFPQSLQVELERDGLDKGGRGELVTMLLCLQARDAAAHKLRTRAIPVLDFIHELLPDHTHGEVFGSNPTRARTEEEAGKTLEETFANSKMYFNHFIKVGDRDALTRDILWRLIARGAAVLCADLQQGLDVLIPFLYWDDVLSRLNVSAFLCQSKNDKGFQRPIQALFDQMDPVDFIFTNKDSKPNPTIRIVFALASPNPGVTVLSPPKRVQPTRRSARTAKFKANDYTAFDIWCATASKTTFKPITDDGTFRKLLRRDDIFPGVYDTKPTSALQDATRNMNPAAGRDDAHWSRFIAARPDPVS